MGKCGVMSGFMRDNNFMNYFYYGNGCIVQNMRGGIMNKLGTKAETLQMLYGKLKYALILPQMCFTVQDWNTDKNRILAEYEAQDWRESVVVRSSSLAEDTQTESSAGKYESVLNVSGKTEFMQAVERVLRSYDDMNPQNQVLVQPMLKNVKMCGVAFTIDPNTGGNYYVINYDSTGSTSAVTSGNGPENYLYYQFKGNENVSGTAEMKRLCRELRELEDFFSKDHLDVEFALTEEKQLYILQVRTLCMRESPVDLRKQESELKRIQDRIHRSQSPRPFLCGRKTIYGVMTDWNPAEMIGIRPKPLAMSLYREVITDNIWAYQRDNYGYRNLRSFPLMVDFGGLPYIDIRVSFNSFVPAVLAEEISDKLVNYYLDRLEEKPQKHDKAEFEIVFSCYTLDLPERIQILEKYGFSQEEIRQITDSLRSVTNHIIDHKDGLWRKDYEKIKLLNERYAQIMAADMEDTEKIYWLIEDCKRYGTLPFAGLARAAFIAVQILQSLVTCGILTKKDYEAFMNGVSTVSSGMNADFREMSAKAFLDKYGHLRPGTYDISSLRYDEAPELYFDWNMQTDPDASGEKETFRLSLSQLKQLKQKLDENRLTNDILELLEFIRTVIEGREYGKFAFTRNLSKALQMIAELGRREGIPVEDCAYVNVQDIRAMYVSTKERRTCLEESVKRGKESYEITKTLTLPPLIIRPEEVMGFFYPDSEPNFITSGRVSGKVCLMEGELRREDLKGKILLIPSADPGYDWIFSHGISGFITMYGGANSHMAIRAGELSVPAAVGVGTKAFAAYKQARMLEIDASGKLIRVLK